MSATIGMAVVDQGGRSIGRVDAVFADYLLVRTVGLPVDLYLPTDRFTTVEEQVVVDVPTAKEAYDLWHRPLKKAPHP